MSTKQEQEDLNREEHSMKLETQFPALRKSQKTLVVNTFLVSYQAILSAPKEEILQFVVDKATEEQINSFPAIKEEIKKYKNTLV